MNIVAIIPARWDSTRFPGKILANKTGRPLIAHVYEQVCKAGSIDRVMVATDDRRIADACEAIGADFQMTRTDHETGSDRIAEVAERLEADIIVNVQGDEPEILPSHIDLAVKLLQDDDRADITTLSSIIDSKDELENPNVVKVVLDADKHAMYFSRWPVPYVRDSSATEMRTLHRKHIGMYVYRRPALLKLTRLPLSPLEGCERLEQLRALENGMVIAVADVKHYAEGIDTPEQYERFVERFRQQESVTSSRPDAANKS
jgi:3-deoxy-manno-octulosonate cytidylyltransferase (CMP-KDO synthetase)